MNISYSLAGKVVVYIKSEHVFTLDTPGSINSWANLTEDLRANRLMFGQVNLHGLEEPGLLLEVYPNPQNACNTLTECQQIRPTFIRKSRELAEGVCKHLTYKFCELFTVDRVVESELRYEQRDENGGVTPIDVAELKASASIDCIVTKKFTANDVEDLEHLFRESIEKRTRISFFYESLKMTDPAATYMFLYGLGLDVCGGKKQEDFDDCIELLTKNETGKPSFCQRKGLQENWCKKKYKADVKTLRTWYTYVRNRLAHFKSEPSEKTKEQPTFPPIQTPENFYGLSGILEIKQEMSRILPEFTQIVREVIEEKC